MTKNLLHYIYDTTVREIYDLIKEEASKILEEKEKNTAKGKNHALILTGKGYENKSFFDAFTPAEISRNYTWIHFCPQEILNFDDDTPQKDKYYILVFESVVKES